MDVAETQSESTYQILFENMAEGFALYELVHDEQGHPVDWRILKVNGAYERHTGIPRSQIVGRRISELFPAAIPEYLPRFVQVVTTQTPIDFETYAVAVGRHQHVSTFPAGGARFASIIEDITERKEAEEALRRSEAFAHKILTSSQNGLYIYDLELGRNVFINPQYTALTGYALDDINGMSGEQFLDLFHPEDRDRVVAHMEAVAQAKHDVLPAIDYRFRTTDGRWIWCLSRETVFDRAPDGAVRQFIGTFLDITDRREAEEALRQSQSDLERAQEVGQMGSWRLDVRRNVLTWSEQNHRIFGVPQGTPLTYETFLETVHPEDRQTVDARWQAGLRGQPYDIEHRIVVDDQVRWVREKAYLEWDDAGTLLGGFGITQDITERKRAEEVLRQYAERLRFLHEVDEAILAARSAQEVAEAVVEHAPRLLPCLHAGVIIHHPEVRQLSLMAAYSRGGRSELGPGWRAPVGPAGDPALETLVRGEGCVVDDLQALPDVSPLVAQLQAERVRAQIYEPISIRGQFLGIFSLGLDVPGPVPAEQREVVGELVLQLAVGLEQARLHEEVQRHAEELEVLVQQRTSALEASEARFRAIFEEAAIGIALADPEGRLMATNPALQRILGYSEAELVGVCLLDLLAVSADEGEERFAKLLAGQQSEYGAELQFTRKDGETGDANVTVSLLHAGAAGPPLLLALVEDITERKRAQQALIRAERLTLMGRMAASLAHEVNNPLQSVVGCLDLALEVQREGEDPTRFVTVAMEESERAARIVHRMRDLSRRDDGQREPVRVDELVDKVILLTQKQARNRHVEVIREAGEGLPPVAMVRDRIQQVFLNLVLNAIDAMPDGGELRIRAVRTGDPYGVEISFADTGVGIPAKDLPRVFEAFHTSKEHGLGLGLHVSHGIVREHGGQIDVQSEAGHGTTFAVWLPAT